MRKFLIPIAVAGSALTLAAPAAAQWAPPVYNYQPYAFGRTFSGRGFANAMENRVQRIRSDIRVMEARRILSRSEARSLERQAASLQFRIARVSRFGITAREARSVEFQIRNLERRVAREATDWNRRPGNRRY